MKVIIRLGLAVCAGLVLSSASVRADEVHLSDGSKLVGTIESAADGKLTLSTEFAGKLVLDLSRVTGIVSAEPLNVEFASGDRLVGVIEAGADSEAGRLKSEVGEVPLTTDKVKFIWRPSAESPEVVAMRAEAEKKIEALKPDWTIKLEAGGNKTEGNTETFDAQGRFDLIRKTESDLLNFYLAAIYSEQNQARTKNEYRGGVKYEGNVTDRWYWYTRLELEYDEFENLDLRTTAAAGAGYYWLRKPEHELKSRVGVGYRNENYTNGRTEDDVITDLGLDYRVQLAKFAEFTHSTTYSPSLEDFSNYRLDFDTALALPLKDNRWKFKVGMRNEYNSMPAPGLERLDNTYYANIVLELKY